MKRLIFVFTVLLALMPVAAFAANDGSHNGGFLLRIGGDIHVAAGESFDSVFVINGNAVIDGTVHNAVWVIDGDATVSGTSGGDIMVISGTLDLKPTATVKNVTLVRSTLTRDDGATVNGSIHTRSSFPSISWGFLFFVWLSMTVLVVVAGLIFAGAGGRQLAEMTALIGRRPGESILAAVILWIGVPIGAVLTMLTVVGIPIGIGILLFLLPALWFLGYLVSGTALGTLLVTKSRGSDQPGHPYLGALVGLALLQAVALVPVVGGFVILVAGMFGGGVLAYRLWRGWRGRTPAQAPTAIAA